jgi:hypothetical protein
VAGHSIVIRERIPNMKGLALLGVVLVVLGLLSFVVPVPHSEDHGVKVGDAKIGIETHSSEKLPPAVGLVLVAGGVISLVAGSRKG